MGTTSQTELQELLLEIEQRLTYVVNDMSPTMQRFQIKRALDYIRKAQIETRSDPFHKVR